MPRTLERIAGCLLACCAFYPASAGADEPAYFVERMIDLELTEGTLQAKDIPRPGPHALNWRLFWLPTYIVLDGPGEAYWSYAMDLNGAASNDLVIGRQALFARLPKAGVDVAGQMFYFNRDTGEYRKVRFKIAADKAKADFRQPFYSAKAGHYRHPLESGIPGGAWFRHQMQVARAELGSEKDAAERPARASGNRNTSDFNTTFALFSGGRAISENLQLDRTFTNLQNGTAEVPIEKLDGITVAEIDWSKLTAGKQPQLDPLASYIPADQHAVFFPSFSALIALADEADRQSTLVLEAAEPRAEDFRVVERYQRQLGLQTTALGRMLGPQVIASVALTGGDPYFRLGTDVAVIFQPTKDAAALQTLLATQIALNTAGEKQVVKSSGEVQGVKYQAWTSPGRRVSSYLATLDGVVVVTNSPAQLQRLDDTRQGRQKPIDSLAEYRFFRDRYRRDDAAETALLFLSDATIRRWCGPQWRIGDSRRTRDLAVLSEAQAAAVPELVAGSARQGPVESVFPLSDGERLELAPLGVASKAIGTLEFLTPISERPPTMVSRAEADAYQFWRDGYQRNFRWAFDPIALRLTIAGERLAADLTVMPLIAASDYNELISLSKGIELSGDSGDPHDSLAQVVLAINHDSELMKQVAGYVAAFAPQFKVNPLSWLGKSVSVYVDDWPLWKELAAIESESQRRKWIEDQGWQASIAVNIEISSTLKAVAFLVALRAFIEQTAHGMLNWEDVKRGEQSYVKISATERGRQVLGRRDAAIYYALTADAWTISPDEKLIQRVLDRADARFAARSQAKPAGGASADKPDSPTTGSAAAESADRLGTNLTLTAEAPALEMLGAWQAAEYRAAMQLLAWKNLPILNEWKRRFPQQDPVELHERLWGVRLICPGGGQYVWNERWQTMQSTVYGHPSEPKLGPAAPPILGQLQRLRLGLSFEEHGLRGRAELLRKKP